MHICFQNLEALFECLHVSLGDTFLGLQPSGDDFGRTPYDNHNDNAFPQSHDGFLLLLTSSTPLGCGAETSETSVVESRAFLPSSRRPCAVFSIQSTPLWTSSLVSACLRRWTDVRRPHARHLRARMRQRVEGNLIAFRAGS